MNFIGLWTQNQWQAYYNEKNWIFNSFQIEQNAISYMREF